MAGRGKFKKTSGTVVLDREAGSGTVDVKVDTSSLDMGHDKLNDHVKSDAAMLDVAKYPDATYTGKLTKFVDGDADVFRLTSLVCLTVGQREAQIDGKAVGVLPLQTEFELCVLSRSH